MDPSVSLSAGGPDRGRIGGCRTGGFGASVTGRCFGGNFGSGSFADPSGLPDSSTLSFTVANDGLC